MKKLLAKLLIAALVISTITVPAGSVFAEVASTETATAGQAATAEAAEEVVEDELKFLYLDQQKIEAPGTQNIAVSWKDDIDSVTDMVLLYENSRGNKFEIKESERTETSILFTKEFTSNETDIYTVKGIRYYAGGIENYMSFDDVQIDADFEVVDEVSADDEENANKLAEKTENNVVVVESEGGSVDKTAVEAQVMAILDEADVTKTSSNKNIVVVLDPGHGDDDPGAIGGGLKERDLNLKIAMACYNELNEYPTLDVYMTRTTNGEEPTIAQRVEYAASVNADILVSIHINSSTSSSANGAEVWTPNANYNKTVYTEGQALSKSIQKELTALGLYDRGVKMSYSKDNTRYSDGSLADYYGIIRESKKKGFVGIIVEHAFISNSGDREYLNSDSKLNALGIADAQGIVNYYGVTKGAWEDTAEGRKYKYADGTYAEGYTEIKNAYYYFNDDGIMQKYSQMIDGKPYYFNGAGEAAGKGWITFKDGNKRYCEGNGKLATGYKKIGKYYYYFDAAGTMQKYSQMIDGKPYYFNGAGKAAGKGWITFKDGNKRYCEGNGKLATGYKKIGKYYYYFDAAGTMQKYSQMIDGKPYYFNGAGKAAGKGWITFKDGNKRYCEGNGKLATGTVRINGKNYSFAADGSYINAAATSQYSISGTSNVTVNQMAAYYKANRGNKYPSEYKATEANTIEKLCQIYYNECKAEGIKPEVAFCQAMKETGWLKFGGDVDIKQYNFAGIGATGGGNPGHSFESVTIGVRAHVQHLKAYANNDKLVKACVDPRFGLVKRGTAPYVEWLGQKANPNGYGWAPAATYGTDIVQMIKSLKTY